MKNVIVNSNERKDIGEWQREKIITGVGEGQGSVVLVHGPWERRSE